MHLESRVLYQARLSDPFKYEYITAAILAVEDQGELRAEGRVKDLVALPQMPWERVFLRVIGFQN